jgi:xanthine dehydrogenase small subunit
MISFYLNDQAIHTTKPAASALLDFVRYHEHLTLDRNQNRLP